MTMARFQRHLFVCTNRRPDGHPRGSCGERGAAEVVDALKQGLHERGLKRVVRVQGAGCLDQCAKGVAAVCYPEGLWYGGVRPEDAGELLDRTMRAGEPIERLVIPDDELTGIPPNDPEEAQRT